MNILYCGDANMADGLLLSILSLRHHHQQSLHIYILTATLQTAQKTYRPLSNQTVAFLETQLKQDDPDNTIQKKSTSPRNLTLRCQRPIWTPCSPLTVCYVCFATNYRNCRIGSCI